MNSAQSGKSSQQVIHRWAIPCMAAFILAACGGPAPSTLSLLPESSLVEIIRGQTLELSVTVSRSSSAAVELSVAGAPTGVTAVFENTSLPAGVNQARLLITAAPGAPESSAILTLTAVSGSVAATVQVDLVVDSLTVSGRVLGLLDIGMPDVQVLSQGLDTVSAADGSFELSGLSTPYDLLLVYDDGGDGLAHLYQGLSHTTPWLTPIFGLVGGGFGSVPWEATVSGEVLGGDPLPADHVVIICAEGLDFAVYGCSQASAPDDSYLLDLFWLGPEDASVRIHAIRAEVDAGGDIVDYHGHISHLLELSDLDVLVLDLDIESSVSSAPLQAEIVLESGPSMSGAIVLLNVGPHLSIPLTDAAGPTVEFLVPTGSGYAYTLLAEGGSGFAWRSDVDLNAGQITIPLAPTQLAPSDGAPNVGPGTQFRAFVPDDHAITYVWSPDTVGPVVALTAVDDGPVNLPDLAGTPFGYVAGSTYDWQLFGSLLPEEGGHRVPGLGESYSTILLLFTFLGGPGPVHDGSFVVSSSSWAFDLAP